MLQRLFTIATSYILLAGDANYLTRKTWEQVT